MSIPPLVCSTPPPPDQCDDKDIDDFDVQYSLSQEDYDSQEYDYRNFTSFNHFQAATKDKETIQSTSVSKPSKSHTELLCQNPVHNQKIHFTEHIENSSQCIDTKNSDELLEDLDLTVDELNKECHNSHVTHSNLDSLSEITKVHIDEEAMSKLELDESIYSDVLPSLITDSDDKTISNVVFDESLISNTTKSNAGIAELSNDQNITDLTHSVIPAIDTIFVTNYINETLMLNEISVDDKNRIDIDKEPNVDDTVTFQFSTEMISSVSEDISNKNINTSVHENDLCGKPDAEVVADEDDDDDGFGDFENFKDPSPENQTSTVINDNANPWQNQTCDSSFGKFEANFAEVNPNVDNITSSTIVDQTASVDNDDDFGDFDDFQTSSARKQSVEVIQTNQLNEEEIENSIKSIFGSEVIDTNVVCEGKLESHLCETWRHLMEIDIRQPYMINWNSTLGQKTLLKALCIDSRNILFAPKWSQAHNMPKFAANLSAAPLQPQKPMSACPDSSSSIKPADTWVGPMSTDQEFTYAEALLLDLEHLMATLDQMAHNNSSLKISDLLSHACIDDNSNTMAAEPPPFVAAVPITPDSLYSLTPTVQPLRHINLPDTHIYTPTDSETPQSTTIHYNSGTPTTLPQTITNNDRNEDDYEDFQDYKSASTTVSKDNALQSTGALTSQVKTEIRFETQILQPIKVEPVMPTLNWPEPGQVKEDTFDVFTDFVSNTSWTSDNVQSTSYVSGTQNPVTIDKPEIKQEPLMNTSSSNQYDDDFNTFQSAIPSTKSNVLLDSGMPVVNNSSNLDQKPSFEPTKPNTTFDVDFSSLESSIVTFPNPNILTSTVNTNQISHLSSTPLNTFPMSNPRIPSETSSILQPTSISSNIGQVKPVSGQILQPLSLESYSQINWPNPGSDLQDWSRFNPVDTIQSLKTDLNTGGSSTGSPAHSQKGQALDDEWGDFVSSRPVQKTQNKQPSKQLLDDDEWTDFVSSPNVKPQNGLNTISFNVHTNLSLQKSVNKVNQVPLDIPSLNYIRPKSNTQKAYTDSHFQNL